MSRTEQSPENAEISKALHISMRNAKRFKKWAWRYRWQRYDCMERWISMRTLKLISIRKLYTYYKLFHNEFDQRTRAERNSV